VLDDPRVTKGSEKRDIRFSMRLPTSLHSRLRKAAEADRRTMGDFAIIAIERAVEEFEATIAAKKAEKPTR
jgi:predicted DNA-binding protein